MRRCTSLDISEVAQLCPTLCDPVVAKSVAHQTPLSMGFSRQEYWGGLPFPSPGDLPSPGIEPGSPILQADALSSEPPGKLRHYGNANQNPSDHFITLPRIAAIK